MGKQCFRLRVFLISFLALASPALAGVGRWTPYGPPEGALQTLAADAEGNLYTSAEKSGVYKSTDQGRTWSWSGAGMAAEWIQAIVFDPDDDELYAAGETGVFRSTDAGAHWTRLSSLPLGRSNALALAPGEPDTLFLARAQILYRSQDGGATWEQVLQLPFAFFQTLLVDPNDSRSVYAGTGEPGALLHSMDGGTTWAPVTAVETAPGFPLNDPFAFGITDLAASSEERTLFAVAGLRLFRSTNAGTTWHEIRIPGGTSEFVESVAVTSGRAPRVYVFLQNGVHPALYVSENLGDSWTLVTSEARGFRLRVSPETGAPLSLSPGGVGVAEEDGTEWRFSPLGRIQCRETDSKPKLRFARGARSYAVVGGQLFVSRNGGRSWEALAEELAADCFEIRDVAIDPRPNVLWVAADRGIFRSGDSGATWTSVLAGEPGAEIGFAGITLSGRTVLANGCGVWRSSNDGATWQQTLECDVLHPEFGEPEFQRSVQRLEVDPRDARYVYAGAIELGERHPPEILPYVYRSADGGRTWRRLVEGAYVVAIDPSRPETIYRAEPDGIFRSRNRGRSWQRISRFNLFASRLLDVDLEVDPTNPRVLYAARHDGVWRSINGGATWQPLNTGLKRLPAYEIFPDPRRPGRLVLSSEGLFEGRFALPPES